MAAAASQLQPQLVKEPPRPRAKAKAKPKFDIPVETSPVEPSSGWVYRAEAAPVAEVLRTETPRAETQRKHEEPSEPFEMIGEGMFLIGLGSLRLLYRAASGFISAPMRLAGRL
ncbi:MAG TPA: hypothetical protein VHC90_20550 [Bryobacteraceae bacterium]|nr:hypothetical protein [Bryobacteraceae bacterium]